MGTDLGTPWPLLSIHQSGASGVHTAAAEGWHANADYTGQHYVLIRSPHRTNKYCPYTIHNTVTVRIRNLEYLDTYITINNLETCFFSITWNIYTPYSCMLYVKMMFGQLANKKSFKTIDDKLVSEHTLRIFLVFH